MSTIDLFKNSKKADQGGSVQKFSNDIESAEYMEEYTEQQNRFIPSVDYSSFENFVFYGSAKEYYKTAIDQIQRTYPYDGSRAEKVEWRNESTPFTLYVLDEEYPFASGSATFGTSSFSDGSPSTTTYHSKTYRSSSDPSFLTLKGGPGLGDYDGVGDIKDAFGDSNVYDPSENRQSNLELTLTGSGNTVEMWFKAGEDSPNDISVLFDLWNNTQYDTGSYGRFTLEAYESNDTFLLTVESGSNSAHQLELSSSQIDFSKWHHYAVRTEVSSSILTSSLYVDGGLADSNSHTFSSFGKITGALEASVGAFAGPPSGSSTLDRGWGSLSGSIDEFRYWKTKKSEKHIHRNWFTSVHGGTNTDDANTDLGVYYKFNEGTTETASIDSTVLDYSGRVTNATWVNYDNYGKRTSGSAPELAGFNLGNYDGDPIIYEEHPAVRDFTDTKLTEGQIYDDRNTNSLYHSFANWIIDADQEDGHLKNLTQILGTYLDTLQLQIQSLKHLKDKYYNKDHQEPLHFADRLVEEKGLITPDIFANATVLESMAQRTEEEEFEESLDYIKNSIYHNIYNNIEKILKTKGTEESVRNLIRCFGIDRDLIDLKLYADDTEFEFREKYVEDSVKRNFVDFYDTDRFEGTIYQHKSGSDAKSYIEYDSGSSDQQFQPFTLEADVIFPDKSRINEPGYFNTPFQSASLFGFHKVDEDTASTIQWADRDDANLQIYAVQDSIQEEDAKFVLTSSKDVNIGPVETGWIKDVYDNEHWNIGVSVYPSASAAGIVSGSDDSDYVFQFEGYKAVGDTIDKSFKEVVTQSHATGEAFATSSKRVFAGAHRTDFTGSVSNKCDAKIGSVRYWADHVGTPILQEHAKNINTIGNREVLQHAFDNRNSWGNAHVPSIQTLALHWKFDNVTDSDGSGQFDVTDYSSGSTRVSSSYGLFGTTIGGKHTGRADFLPSNSTSSIDVNFLQTLETRWPEYRTGLDDIQIQSVEEEDAPKNPQIKKYSAAVEKSLYDVVNQDILEWFGTVKEFNDLIGDGVEKYRPHYKKMRKLRELFFDRVGNEPDVNRFAEYYRWFDDAISEFVGQLLPAGADSHSDVQNVVESHVLDRSKYHNKYPTIEFEEPDPNVPIYGANRLLLDVLNDGHISASDGSEAAHLDKWGTYIARKEKFESDASQADRKRLWHSITSSLDRELAKPYHLLPEKMEFGTASINPVSTHNVPIESGAMGNYWGRYNYLQVHGKRQNPGAFLNQSEKFADRDAEIPVVRTSRDEKGLLPRQLATESRGTGRELPQISSSETVFRTKFSAPGDFFETGRGYLDPRGEEYSPYNQINYRNLSASQHFVSESAKHYSFDKTEDWHQSLTVTSDTNPKFHKVPRNGEIVSASGQAIIASSEGGFFYESFSIQWDNAFVRHQIPRTPLRYSWIHGNYRRWKNLNIHYSSFDDPDLETTGGQVIPFVSKSEEVVQGDKHLDFAGLNTIYSTSLDTGSLTLGIEDNEDTETLWKSLNNKGDGPFGYSSWEQVRVGNDLAARWLSRNNYLAIQNDAELKSGINSGRGVNVRARYGVGHEKFKEPAVSKYKNNLNITLNLGSNVGGNIRRTFQVPFKSDLDSFQNRELIGRLDAGRCNRETYNKFSKAYLLDSKNSPFGSDAEFHSLVYNQKLFPREQNSFLGVARNRSHFRFSQWEEKRDDREKDESINSMGVTVLSQSKWPLDARQNFEDTDFYDGRDYTRVASASSNKGLIRSGGPGELQNEYNRYNWAWRYNRLGMHFKSGSNEPGATSKGGADMARSRDSETISDYDDTQVISAWFYIDSGSYNKKGYGLVSLANGNTQLYLQNSSQNSQQYVVRFFQGWKGGGGLWEQQDDANSQRIDTGKWYNVTVGHTGSSTQNNTVPDIYVNDQEQSVTTVSGASGERYDSTSKSSTRNFIAFCPATGSGDNRIHTASYYMDGYISDVAIYLGTSNVAQVASDEFNGGIPNAYPDKIDDRNSGLHLYYPLGNTAEDTMVYVADRVDDKNEMYMLWANSGSFDSDFSDFISDRPANREARARAVFPSYTQKFLNDNSQNASHYDTQDFSAGERFDITGDTSSSLDSTKDDPLLTGPSYIRRVKSTNLLFDSFSAVATAAFVGSAKWEATSSTSQPFYDDEYDGFAENIRHKAKNLSTLPEFRASEHVEDIVENYNGNFLADKSDIFSLTGSEVNNSQQDEFMNKHVLSDTLNDFEIIEVDHESSANTEKINFEAEVVKKFLPYEDLYPMNRSLSLASLLSQSYSPSVELHGSDKTFQTFMTPFYAPGIMYNSIKSGLAVDYPIHTGSYGVVAEAPHFEAVERDNWMVREYQNCFHTNPELASNMDVSGSYTFDFRIPFEGILNPQSYASNIEIAHDEVEAYGTLHSSASLSANPSPLYDAAAHNFFGGVVDFFLQNDRNSTFRSSFETQKRNAQGFEFSGDEVGKTFAMDVILRNSDVKSFYEVAKEDWYNFASTVDVRDGADRVMRNKVKPHSRMFDKAHAFGPPTEAISYEATGALDSATCAAYTPSYFDGFSRARVLFTPEREGFYTIEEIQRKAQVESTRFLEDRLLTASPLDRVLIQDERENFLNPEKNFDPYAENGAGDCHMQVGSSIELFGTHEEQDVQQWVISSKFETPTLNFQNSKPTTHNAPHGDSQPRGMWLQSGSQFDDGEGITFGLQDVPEVEFGDSEDGPKYAPNIYTRATASIRFVKAPADGDKIKFDDPEGAFGTITYEFDKDDAIVGGTDEVVQIVSSSLDKQAKEFAQTFQTTKDTHDLRMFVEKVEDNEVILKKEDSRSINSTIITTDFANNPTYAVDDFQDGGNTKDIRSLREKLGFRESFTRIGNVKENHNIWEAIIAVPFLEKDGERSLYEVSEQEIQEEPNGIIARMNRTMQKYNFPPRLNYMKFDQVDPFLFIPFEFSVELSKDDLYDIWQNTIPTDSNQFQEDRQSFVYDLEQLPYIDSEDLTDNFRLAVFKVKQKAPSDYSEITSYENLPVSAPDLDYSYNWPYDFCSVVELGKIDASILMESDSN